MVSPLYSQQYILLEEGFYEIYNVKCARIEIKSFLRSKKGLKFALPSPSDPL